MSSTKIVKSKCVRYCTICGRIKDGSSIHLFPKKIGAKKLWASFCQIETDRVKPMQALCSKHFTADCYKKTTANRKLLKPDSIPTLNTSTNILASTKSQSEKLYYRSCILCGGSNDRHLHYHRFPNDPTLRLQWAQFCGIQIEDIKINWRLCNKHFSLDSITKVNKLVENAVPSISVTNDNLDDTWEENIPPDNLRGRVKSHAAAVNGSQKLSSGNLCSSPIEFEQKFIPQHDGSEFLLDESILQVAEYCEVDSAELTPNIPKPARKEKVVRYFGDVTSAHVENATPEMLKKYISLAKETIRKKNKLFRATQERVRRMSARMHTLKNVIAELENKNLANAEAAAHLDQMPHALKELALKRKVKAKTCAYSDDVRKMAVTLYFYSPKAYSFVRGKFDNLLPHPSSLRRYCSTVGGQLKQPRITNAQIGTCSEAAQEFFKMAVLSRRHPNVLLEQGQANLLQEKLREAVDVASVEVRLPQFLDSKFIAGILWMTCTNSYSRDWLIKTVSALGAVWEGADLTVLDSNDFREQPKVQVWIPGNMEAEAIKSRFGRQNPELKVADWLILSTKRAKKGNIIVFSLDQESYKTLKRNVFKAFWRLGKVTFQPIEKAYQNENTTKEAPKVAGGVDHTYSTKI